jgi:hypothetical protein
MKKTFTKFLEGKSFNISDILLESDDDRIVEKIRKAVIHFKNEVDGDVPPAEILELAKKFSKSTKSTFEKAMAAAATHKEYVPSDLAKDASIILTIAGEATSEVSEFLKICQSTSDREKEDWETKYTVKISSDDVESDVDVEKKILSKSVTDGDEDKTTSDEYEDSEGNIVKPTKSKFADKLADKMLSKENNVVDKKVNKIIICVATEQDDPEIPRSGVFGYPSDDKITSAKILAIDNAADAEALILATETFKTEKDFIRKLRKFKGDDEVKLFIFNSKDETGKPWKVETK